jgi:hypothetical protein
MTVYRSERERHDEETGHWQLLDEIMEAIRCEYQTPMEVIEALVMAIGKVVAQADFTPEQLERINIKRMVDNASDFQRHIEFTRPARN